MQGICSCLCVSVLFNPLTTDNTIWHRLTLAACYHQLASTIHFEERFCTRKKGGIGGGGQVSAWVIVHMAAALSS